MVTNAQKEMDRLLLCLKEQKTAPSLLLHSCCAPCSSYVLEYLSDYFKITVLYYNPNIYPAEEYLRRMEEQKRLIAEMPLKNPVRFEEGKYDSDRFFAEVKGLEKEPEGGSRCHKCYELRIREAARAAKAGGYDYFTTTLSVSPHKNAAKLNELGQQISGEYGIPYLSADFKKKNGYLRSIRLSEEYGLYRQKYCGCLFSVQNQQ